MLRQKYKNIIMNGYMVEDCLSISREISSYAPSSKINIGVRTEYLDNGDIRWARMDLDLEKAKVLQSVLNNYISEIESQINNPKELRYPKLGEIEGD